MEKFLVFGASGMLGRYLTYFLRRRLFRVVDTRVDITKEDQVFSLIRKSNPDYVINCAAYTNVDGAENEEYEMPKAYDVNANAPLYMAKCAEELSIPFVHISTDYVFGDNSNDGYDEYNRSYNPLNVYGASKLLGEKNVLYTSSMAYVIRTSWLFGHNAKNFVYKIVDRAKNGKVFVVTDEVGCPTYVKDLSETIVYLLMNRKDYGIYHCCSRDAISRYEFAEEIFKAKGMNVQMYGSKLEDYPRAAVVPNISILKNTKLPPMRTSWEMVQDFCLDEEDF